MKLFSIYVKTSPLGKTGIHWRHIMSQEQENQLLEIPSLINHEILKNPNPVLVNDLLDVVKPSILIFRDGNDKKLLLEVTGIESPKRSERMGRKVLNSIVFITDDQDNNEQKLRKIAYSAIKNILGENFSFSEMIQECIDFYQLEEFRVDLEKIEQFIDNLPSVNNQIRSKNNNYQIDIFSDEYLQKLAEDLKNHRLPKEWNSWEGKTKTDGVLVVVTDSLEEKTILHEVGVWRGLAKNVEQPVKLMEVEEPETETTPEKSPTEETEKKKFPAIIISLVLLLLILIVIIISLNYSKPQNKNLKINCQNTTENICPPQNQTPTPMKN